MSAPLSFFGVTAITVADLDRSTRFYRDALGFTERNTTSPGGGSFGVTARFLEKDGVVLEIVEFVSPPPAEGALQPMGRLGMLSHLAFNVGNLAEVEAAIQASGGTIVEPTRLSMELTGFGPVEIIYARDPDGIWIELISIDEAKRRRYVGIDP
jgi:catechol 2,3-dioxygenase-like lactoylglutathione lyase family enzyme